MITASQSIDIGFVRIEAEAVKLHATSLLGIFDKSLDLQYEKGRITGTDYATVYMQGLIATSAQAIDLVKAQALERATIAKEKADMERFKLELAHRLAIEEFKAKTTSAQQLINRTGS